MKSNLPMENSLIVAEIQGNRKKNVYLRNSLEIIQTARLESSKSHPMGISSLGIVARLAGNAS